MDFMLSDTPASDPFLSLQPDLDDVSEVIRQHYIHENPRDEGWRSIEDQIFHQLPDQDREIGSIVTMLQEDIPIHPTPHSPNNMDITIDGGYMNSPGASSAGQISPIFQHYSPTHSASQKITFGIPPNTTTPQASVHPMVKTETASHSGCSSTSREQWKEDMLKKLDTMNPTEIEHFLKKGLGNPPPPLPSPTSNTQLQPPTSSSAFFGHQSQPGHSVRTSRPAVGVATKLSSEGTVLETPNNPAIEVKQSLSPAPSMHTTEGGSDSGYNHRPTPSPFSQSPPGDDSDTEDGTRGSTPGRPYRLGAKPERRTAHNLIERKYRCSINDKINELKEMLSGTDTKLSKSGILKKAIDYIQYLREQNTKLKERNRQLEKALAVSSQGSVSPASTVVGLSPSESGEESSSTSAHHSHPPSSSSTPRTMLDRSKVTMFVLMLCLVVMNPFQLGSIDSGPSIVDGAMGSGQVGGKIPGSRVLNSYFSDVEESVPDDSWWQDKMFRMMCLWLLNGLVIACVLARVLIYGEPVTDIESRSWNSFRSHHTLAEQQMAKNDLRQATFHLSQCLRVLGRPLPSTPVDEWASFLWHFFRHLLNRAWIGKWLSKQRRGSIKPQSVMRSHGQAALVYHQLHQLHMMGEVEGSPVLGIGLALSAVNLAEASGTAFCPVTLVEIYTLAALRAQKHFPRLSAIIQTYFMVRARMTVKKDEVKLPWNLGWIFQPMGEKFLNHAFNFSAGSKTKDYFPFCTIENNGCFLDHLTANFKIHLLQNMIQVLSTTNKSEFRPNSVENKLNRWRVSEILEWSHLLTECSGPREPPLQPHTVQIVNTGDELCSWWTSLLTCAVHGAVGEREKARHLYQRVRSLPKALLSDGLALAVGHAFCARKVCWENKGQNMYEQLVWLHCCKGHQALRDHHSHTLHSSSTPLKVLIEGAVLEWLLVSLGEVWREGVGRRPYWEHTAVPPLLKRFSQLLLDFRTVVTSSDSSRLKVLMHETTFRMISGANPVTTWQLLQRCVRLARDSDEITDSDRNRLGVLVQFHDNF